MPANNFEKKAQQILFHGYQIMNSTFMQNLIANPIHVNDCSWYTPDNYVCFMWNINKIEDAFYETIEGLESSGGTVFEPAYGYEIYDLRKKKHIKNTDETAVRNWVAFMSGFNDNITDMMKSWRKMKRVKS